MLGGPAEQAGYDLTGVVVGSEGTFGVVTKVWVRITREPEAYRTLLGVFETVDDATKRHQRHHRRGHRAGRPWSCSTPPSSRPSRRPSGSASPSTPGRC